MKGNRILSLWFCILLLRFFSGILSKFFVNFSESSKMGKHFGNLQRLKGVVYYTLSPLELNPFMMIINPGLPNFIRRLIRVITPSAIPLTSGFLVYDWAKKEHARLNRKNPDDFKDDI